jgi:hypothetical protein
MFPDVAHTRAETTCWEASERIRQSKTFRKSPSLARLLSYVVEQTLKNRHDLLSEQQIGIAVFGRPPGYNAGEDSIVRVMAHKLRQKLEEYYQTEGIGEPLRLEIPKGQYAVVWNRRPIEPDSTAHPGEQAPAGKPSPRPRRRLMLAATASALFLTALLLFGWLVRPWQSRIEPTVQGRGVAVPRRPANPLLQAVFSPSRQTLVVVEDAMLILANFLRGRPYRLEEYVSGELAPDLSATFRLPFARERTEYLLRVGRYVNLPNITFATGLLRFFPELGAYAVFRHPREVQMRDLKDSHVILFGGRLSNPWLDLYEDRLAFPLRTFDQGVGFLNRRPAAGEPDSWGDSTGDGTLTYGRIALLRNTGDNANALILTGMGMPETEAAAELLLQPDLYQRFPDALRMRLQTLPSHVEILFSARRVGRAVGYETQVVAWRTLP